MKKKSTDISYIKDSYNSTDTKQVESYITNGGWSARKNGRDLCDNKFRCVESTTKHILTITVTNPSTDWKEWIKTLGMLSVNEDDYSIHFEGESIHFQVKETKNGYVVSIPDSIVVEKPKFSKLFKQVFRKSAYCAACQVCETNCRNGCIKFTDGKLSITDCIHCYQCHKGKYMVNM